MFMMKIPVIINGVRVNDVSKVMVVCRCITLLYCKGVSWLAYQTETQSYCWVIQKMFLLL